MFKELKDYIASHTKEEIQEDWKETPEFESGMTVEEFLQYLAELLKSCVFLNTTGKYNL